MFEALVTLAIIALTVAALSGLYISAMRGVKFAQERSQLLDIMSRATNALPPPEQFAPGTYSGTIGIYKWQAEAHLPASLQNIETQHAPSAVQFVPLEVTISAIAPSGQSLQITTFRSMRRRGR